MGRATARPSFRNSQGRLAAAVEDPDMQQAQVHTEDAIRSSLCARVFWSDHPLIALYQERTGLAAVRIRDLKKFAISLPQQEFNACLFGAGVVS